MGRHCEAVKFTTYCHSERDGAGRLQKLSHCSLLGTSSQVPYKKVNENTVQKSFRAEFNHLYTSLHENFRVGNFRNILNAGVENLTTISIRKCDFKPGSSRRLHNRFFV